MFINKLEKVYDYLQDNIEVSVMIILQLAFAFTLIYYSVNNNLEFYKLKNKVENRLNGQDLYYIDNNEDYTLKLYEKENINEYIDFYNYLEKNYKVLNCKNNNVFIPNNEISEELSSKSLVRMNSGNEVFSLFKGYWVNKGFLDYFKIEVSQGRLFEEKDFIINDIEEPTPVILGNYFKNYFKIGDEIKFKDYDYGGISRYLKIIGFLSENQYIINKPIMATNVEDLNYSILLPNREINLNFVDLSNKNVIDNINLDSYKNITESFLILNSEEDTREIKNKSDEMHFFDISLVGSNKSINNIEEYFNSEQKLNIIIDFLIITSITISILINIGSSINKRKKEFKIYYAFGANNKYIINLILLEQSIYFIFGVICSVIFISVFRKINLIDNLNIKAFFITIIIFMLINGISNMILYINLNKHNEFLVKRSKSL